MAGWISSKLKVAEHLLQQIDQQAAESLGHGERKSSDGLDFTTSPKLSPTLPLKDQLKKKVSHSHLPKSGKFGIDSNGNKIGNHVIRNDVKPNQKSPSSVNDADWTELLSTPNSPIAQGSSSRRGVRRGVGSVARGRRLVGTVKANVDGHEFKKSGSDSRVLTLGNGEKASGDVANPAGYKDEGLESNDLAKLGKLVVEDVSQFVGDSTENIESVPAHVSTNGTEGAFEDEYMRSESLSISNCDENVAEYVSGDVKSSSHVGRGHESESESGSGSDSGSESSSSSNSEAEREREERRQRRREILAAKAAAKVAEAIKEQENVVARLEGEKQSLEKILEERAKQADQEASKLQSTMIETMEATDLEKQKHNHTRMEVLARLAKVETANADLAKSLANVQWNLEMEVNNVAELRRLVDAKELVHEELKRQIYNTHQTRTSLTSLMPYKGFELEREMLEGECSFIIEKTAILQEKATKLEADIDVILKETESPTEVEVELKRRLRQMTDHLIQKQAQVETLSSEKATLLFRIEAVLRLLDENKSKTDGVYTSGSSREDPEEGTYDESGGPNLRMLRHKIQSGKQHLGSLVRQLDVIYYAGSLFLTRNPAAKLWSLVYLVCLHLWVLYILFRRSQSTDNSMSSSVISLENINNSIGV